MTEEEKRAPLEGVRGEVIDRALGEAQHDREAAMLRRERDEARAQVKAWQDEELERRRERDEARAVVAARWALAREVEELLGIAAGPAGDDRLREGVEAVRRLRAERDEAILRAERSEAALAALREAWARYDRSCGLRALQDPGARIALDAAIADTAATAEAYTRRVRAEALREAAACTVDGLRLWGRKAQGDAFEWLRARADEIERGER